MFEAQADEYFAKPGVSHSAVTCGICIVTWSRTTHQIWSQSAEPLLSHSFAAHFDTLHTARATCMADPPNESQPAAVKFLLN